MTKNYYFTLGLLEAKKTSSMFDRNKTQPPITSFQLFLGTPRIRNYKVTSKSGMLMLCFLQTN